MANHPETLVSPKCCLPSWCQVYLLICCSRFRHRQHFRPHEEGKQGVKLASYRAGEEHCLTKDHTPLSSPLVGQYLVFMCPATDSMWARIGSFLRSGPRTLHWFLWQRDLSAVACFFNQCFAFPIEFLFPVGANATHQPWVAEQTYNSFINRTMPVKAQRSGCQSEEEEETNTLC